MTNYIPHYTKKIQILGRKELKLYRLIQSGGKEEKILDTAEEVRQARIRVLRAKRAQIPPKDGPEAEEIALIDEKINAVLAMPVEEIIDDCRNIKKEL